MGNASFSKASDALLFAWQGGQAILDLKWACSSEEPLVPPNETGPR